MSKKLHELRRSQVSNVDVDGIIESLRYWVEDNPCSGLAIAAVSPNGNYYINVSHEGGMSALAMMAMGPLIAEESRFIGPEDD